MVLVIASAAGIMGLGGALWRQYDRNTLDRISIERRLLDVEKHEFEIRQREIALKQAQAELAAERGRLRAMSRENDAIAGKLVQDKEALGDKARLEDVLTLLDQRINEFASLGINLTEAPCQGDPDYEKKYNESIIAYEHCYAAQPKTPQ